MPPQIPTFAPVATCGVTFSPPVVDGNLNDPAWRNAVLLAPFVTVASHEQPTQAVTCRLVRHGERLYAAFECFEDRMNAISVSAQGRDSPDAWADDCVQVFVAAQDPRWTYYQIIVTATNAVHDQRVLDGGQERQPAWDADIISQTRLYDDRWTCELSIPLRDVADGQPLTGPWTFNATRAEHPHNEWSSWSLLNAGVHEFQNFGNLIWAQEPIIIGLDLPQPFIGRNEFRVSLGSAAGTYIAEPQVLRAGKVYPKLKVHLTARSSVSQSYALTQEGRGALRLIVRRPGSHELLYASPPLSFEVPTAGALAQRILARLHALARALPQAKSRTLARRLAAEIARLQKEARAVAEEATRTGGTMATRWARWNDLKRRAAALGPQVRRAEHIAVFAHAGATEVPSFALGTDSSLRKLPPDDSDYSLSRILHLSCARRERESGQVVVASLGDAARRLVVDWTDLQGPSGARLPKDYVAVSLVDYVNTRKPVYPVERVGLWPDPLMPLGPLNVPAGQLRPLWVTVTVPPGTPAGDYAGTISVTPPNGPAQTVKLLVTVWDLELPLYGKFRTGFGTVFHGDLCQWYGFQGEAPEAFRRRVEQLLLQNRVNPAGLYVPEVWPPWEDLDFCLALGMNALCLGHLESSDPDTLRRLAEAASRLAQRQMLHLGYVYGFGSTSQDELARAQEAFEKVRRALPGLRRACPMAPVKQLWGHVNIWGILTSDYDHVSAQRRRHLGEETWWYVCCGPRHPYANFFVDYPATDPRTLFWAAYKYRVTGFFYYEVAMWASNFLADDPGTPAIVLHDDPEVLAAIRAGRRWPEVPWNSFTFSRYNGDGQLLYPGPDQTPLPSLRLEIIRDGIEDYELLALLERGARELRSVDTAGKYEFLVDECMRLTAVSPQVVRDLTHFTDSPSVIAAERQRVARQAMRLQRVLRRLREVASASSARGEVSPAQWSP